jgi:hypothetical protein
MIFEVQVERNLKQTAYAKPSPENLGATQIVSNPSIPSFALLQPQR